MKIGAAGVINHDNDSSKLGYTRYLQFMIVVDRKKFERDNLIFVRNSQTSNLNELTYLIRLNFISFMSHVPI